MKISTLRWMLVCALIAVPTATPADDAAEPPSAREPLVLSLGEAVQKALERNLDLGIERRNPAIRQSEVVIEEAQFDPGLRFELKGGETIRPSASVIDVAILATAVSPIEATSFQYDLGIEQRLAFGGSYKLAWDVTRQGGTSTIFNPNFGSDLSLTVTQPLLKGFGSAVNRTELVLARNNFQISRAMLEGKAAELVAKVEEDYWELVSLRKNYKVQLEKRRAAEELLAMNRAKAEQGLIASVEVLVAESAAADREEDVLSAEKEVRDAEDRLRQAMNLPDLLMSQETRIIPTDEPSVAPSEIPLSDAIAAALDSRWDLRQARLDLANRERELKKTRNQVLPALDFEGTAGLSGLGATYRDDLDRLVSGDFYSWEAGVVFTVPFGNRSARSAFLKQRMETEKSAMNLKRLEQEIVMGLKEAVRRVETDFKRIATTGKSRALAEKKLETETERLRLGLTTTRNVLEFQKDLAEAQSKEIRAIADYNQSLSHRAQVQGTLLGERGIVIGSQVIE